MKASEIRIGGIYLAKVSNKIVQVRVDEIKDSNRSGGGHWNKSYRVTNLATKRTTSFRSAAKFKSEVPSSKPAPSVVTPEYPMPKTERTMTEIRKARAAVAKKKTPVPMKNNGRLQSGAMTALHLQSEKALPIEFAFDEEHRKTLAEIREFEARVGQPWWKGAEKGETWESFKRRGMPTAKVEVAEEKQPVTPPAVPAVQARYPGLVWTPESGRGIPKPQNSPSQPRSLVLTQPTNRKAASEKKPMVSAEPPIANSYGVSVTRTTAGRLLVFGEAVSTTMRWLGAKGCDVKECAALVANLHLEGAVATDNYKSFIGAGAKGFRIPTFTADQEAALMLAAGKGPAPKIAKGESGKKGKGKK